MEENKKYTAADFARYHSGMMSAGEMHALEKAALADPFLADALDGYVYSLDAQKELSEIKSRLDEQKKRNRIFSTGSISSSTWWQVAAIFLVIAGVGFFFFQKNNHNYKDALATNEASAQKERKDSSAGMASTRTEETAALKPDVVTRKVQTPPNKDILSQQAEINDIKKKKNVENELALSDRREVTSLIAIQQNNKHRGENTVVLNDSASVFSSPAMAPTPTVVDTLHDFALSRSAPAMDSSLNEVVVTGYGTKRKLGKQKNVTEELKGKVSGVEISKKTPYLLDGKEKFDLYIKENAIDFPDSVRIVLSFKLNRKRRPSHVKIVSSTCKSCEAQAIKLLKNGPKWVGDAGAKGTVSIGF